MTNDKAAAQELLGKLADMPDKPSKDPKWIPKEKGEKMVGTIEAIGPGRSKETSGYTYISIKAEVTTGAHVVATEEDGSETETETAEEGTTYSLISDTILARTFDDLKVKDGDLVGLEFLGFQESKTRTVKGPDGKKVPAKYKTWKVTVKRDE